VAKIPIDLPEKARIGYFLYGKGLGGNGRYVESLLERLDTSRYEVFVYLYCPAGEDREKFVAHAQKLGVKICALNQEALPSAELIKSAHEPLPGSLSQTAAVFGQKGKEPRPGLIRELKLWLYYFKLTWKIRSFFKSQRLDVLHLSLGTFPTLPHVICGAMLAGIKRLLMIVHILEGIPNPRAVEKFLTARVIQADFPVISLSQTMKRELISRYGIRAERIIPVYNGVDPEASAGFCMTEELRREFKLQLADKAVLVPARFHPIKGHEILFRAIAQNIQALSGYVFLLAGEGPIEEALKERVKELGIQTSVRFIGFRRDIPLLVSACDFTVLPSYNEGFPFVLLEAMAAAKSVIGTDVGAVCEMIEEGSCGFMVKAGDAEGLGKALKNLVSLPSAARQALGGRGRELVLEKFSIDHMAASTFKLYGSDFSVRSQISADAFSSEAGDD